MKCRAVFSSLIFMLFINVYIQGQVIELDGSIVIPEIESVIDEGDVLVRTATGKVKQRTFSSFPLPPTDCDKPWVLVGELADLLTTILPAYPKEEYEYGFQFNSQLIHRAMITNWNTGTRIYNMDMYFVNADDPNIGMRYGGSMFYIGTSATDDDSCVNSWRHKYWYLNNSTSQIVTLTGNGCISPDIYVRRL